MFEQEIWKDIKGYEGKYQVSNFGRIKSLVYINKNCKIKKEKILTAKTTGLYLHVILSKNCKKKNFLIHRLVAKTFIPNPHNLPQVNHKDENKHNNNVNNLEWCNNHYNINYGERNKKTKEKLSIKIEQYDLNNNLIKIWDCMNDAIRYYNNTHICDVCKDKRKTASGYIWRYTDDNN